MNLRFSQCSASFSVQSLITVNDNCLLISAGRFVGRLGLLKTIPMRLTRTDNRNSVGIKHLDWLHTQIIPHNKKLRQLKTMSFVALNNRSLVQRLFRESLKGTSMKRDRSTCNHFSFNWNKRCIILMCLSSYK